MRLVGQDDQTYHYQGDDGKIVKVAKSGMPKGYADGGTVEQVQDISPEDRASLSQFLSTNSNDHSRAIANMREDLAREKEALFIYPDSGRKRPFGFENIDAMTGAPARVGIDEMSKGNFGPGMIGKVINQVGKDPRLAPTGFDVAQRSTDNPYLGTLLATSVDLANLPLPGAGVSGTVKNLGKESNVINAAERFAERAKAPLSTEAKIRQMYNPGGGEVVDAMPELLNRAGRDYERAQGAPLPFVKERSVYDRLAEKDAAQTAQLQEAQRVAAEAKENQANVYAKMKKDIEAEKMAKRRGLQLVDENYDPSKKPFNPLEEIDRQAAENKASSKAIAEKQLKAEGKSQGWRDYYENLTDDAKEVVSSLIARHGDNSKKITKALQSTSEKGLDNLPYTSKIMNDFGGHDLPNYHARPTGVIGENRISQSNSGGAKGTLAPDPFPLMDSKFGSGKQLLARHKSVGESAQIHTSSDLIGRNDYIEQIPKGSTVHMHFMSPNDQVNRLIFPGNPSNARLEAAVKNLEAAGVKVKKVYPSAADVIKDAKADGVDLEKQTGASEEELLKILKMPKGRFSFSRGNLQLVGEEFAPQERFVGPQEVPEKLPENVTRFPSERIRPSEKTWAGILESKSDAQIRYLLNQYADSMKKNHPLDAAGKKQAAEQMQSIMAEAQKRGINVKKPQGFAYGGEVMDNKTQNMSNYKLLKEDDEMFHFQHPSGSTFKVAKHALSGPTLKKIKGMYCGGEVKGYADGGEVDDGGEDYGAEETFAQPSMEMPPQSLMAEPPPQDDMGGLIPPSLLANPSVDEANAVSQPQPQGGEMSPIAQPTIPADYSKMIDQIPGMQEQMQGYNELANAKAMEASGTANALAKYTSKMDEAEAAHRLAYQKIESEQDQLKKDYLDAKIDPKRAIHSMSTGQKIMAAIGIALGGMGSKPNEALKMFENFINNDIDAQKSESSKKLNLYNFNLQKYKNADVAADMTRLNLNSLLQAQILASAAKSGSQTAKANANVLIGGLKAKAMPIIQNAALWQAQAKALGFGVAAGDQGGIPVGQEPMSLLTNDKYMGKRVVIGNRAFQADSPAAKDQLKAWETAVGPIIENVNKLSELAKHPSTKFSGTESNNMAHATMMILSKQLPALESIKIGSKRVKSEDIEGVQELLQNPARFDQALGGIKNIEFLKNLENETEHLRSSGLIGYKGLKSVPFTPLEQNQILPLNKGR